MERNIELSAGPDIHLCRGGCGRIVSENKRVCLACSLKELEAKEVPHGCRS